jgi:uncharacterized protein YgbK (DUF1537 family)
MMDALPDGGPLFSFYGDDFTGSTDSLEALAINGMESVLFIGTPEEAHLHRFRHCRGIGIAGESRSQTPEWMSCHLPGVFRRLRQFGAPVCQYKVCSTFDSSPETGSIGRALEIGQEVFGTRSVPVGVAAPSLKRYVVFGNLFAAGDGVIHRIDRHPTMRRHPVTPMHEADLRLHLGRQMKGEIALVDLLALAAPDAIARLDAVLSERPAAILFDGLDQNSQREAARLIWSRRSQPQMFMVGSSGLTHAMIDYWRAEGWIAAAPPIAGAGAVERLVVVSGSCSPVTERQIRWAEGHGFDGLRLELSRSGDERVRNAVLDRALGSLCAGRSVVLYSALGPADFRPDVGRDELGCYMGVLLRDLLLRSGVRRAVVAGGDTSSHAGRQLGLYALSMSAPLVPGGPLCLGYADDPRLDGLEIVFKGGQVGPDDFFGIVLNGKMRYGSSSVSSFDKSAKSVDRTPST